MKPRLGHVFAIALLVLVTAARAENVFEPGVQHVCVPNTDRSGWDCGTADRPPPGYRKPDSARPDARSDAGDPAVQAKRRKDPEPATDSTASVPAQSEPTQAPRSSPPPPPFLANPNRPLYPMPAPQRGRAGARSTVVATPPPPPPAAEPPATATAPPPSAAPQPATAVAAEASVAAARPDPATTVTIAASAEPVVLASDPAPAAVEDAVPAPVAEPAVVVVAPAPLAAPTSTSSTRPGVTGNGDTDTRVVATPKQTSSASTRSPVSVSSRPLLAALPGARAFARLSADHYTLQLAGAASAEAFPELIARLAIDYRHCYVLHVEREGGDWWLLVYGDYTDLAAARAAASRLPRDPALAAMWPRRVGFLQAEFVPDSNG